MNETLIGLSSPARSDTFFLDLCDPLFFPHHRSSHRNSITGHLCVCCFFFFAKLVARFSLSRTEEARKLRVAVHCWVTWARYIEMTTCSGFWWIEAFNLCWWRFVIVCVLCKLVRWFFRSFFFKIHDWYGNIVSKWPSFGNQSCDMS